MAAYELIGILNAALEISVIGVSDAVLAAACSSCRGIRETDDCYKRRRRSLGLLPWNGPVTNMAGARRARETVISGKRRVEQLRGASETSYMCSPRV